MARIVKTKTGWSVRGSLEDCLSQKKRQLELLNRETDYICKLYKEVERRYNHHFAAINDCKDFIAVVTEKMAKEKENNEKI